MEGALEFLQPSLVADEVADAVCENCSIYGTWWFDSGRTCVSGVHEQTDSIVYEVGEEWGAITRSVTCGSEAEVDQRAAPRELSRRVYPQLFFDRSVIHERFDPVKFFVTCIIPYAWLTDIIRV